MKAYTLSNGLRVIEEPKQTSSVTVQLTVSVGSNNEHDGIRGISHFIEHLVFEGTKKRENARIISNEIESVGGDINAYTDNDRTSFYIKVPAKHLPKALDILSDMIISPTFNESIIGKERDVVLKEINIFNDESRYYQWILFESNLFVKHPAKYPVYGTIKDMKAITRKDIVDYYQKHYVAPNCVLSLAGNTKGAKALISKYFGDFTSKKAPKSKKIIEPKQNSPKTVKIKRKLKNSYMVLGYKVPARLHKDSYVLDVIQSVLGRGQSGKIFDEVRNKRGLAYEVGVTHEPSDDFGYFAIYLSAHKQSLPLARSLIKKELFALSSLTKKELSEAIGHIEGQHLLRTENTQYRADLLAQWELLGNVKLADRYLGNIRKVTLSDISRVAKKYFTKNYTLALIEQQ